MTTVIFLTCLCSSIWGTVLTASDQCPQQCSCFHDNQGELVKVTCTDIIIPSLPETVKHIHVSDAVSQQILPLGQLKAFMFTKRTALETLIIQNYGITSIEDGCFKNNKHLRTLDLSKNKISTLKDTWFEGLGNLTFLKLDWNRIVSLKNSVFRYLTMLKELHMALNSLINIGKYDFQGLINLLKIDLQSNNIISIHHSAFSQVPNLQDINLQNNQLRSLESGMFQGINSLKALNLQNNTITSLEPDCLSSKALLTINLAQNKIWSLPTSFLIHVSNENLEVNLARNMIQEIRANDLKGVVLKTLYLVSNDIWLIEPYAFLQANISTVELEQNQLSTLPKTVERYLNTSNSLVLGNNPWSCDCNIQWLTRILKTKVSGSQEPICAQPAQFFGRKMTAISDELSRECKNSSSLMNSLYSPPRHSLITPEFRKTIPPTYPLRTPRLKSTTTSAVSSTTVTITSTLSTFFHQSTKRITPSIKPKEYTLVSTLMKFSRQSVQNQEHSKTPLIAGVCVCVIIVLCVISGVIIYRVIRSSAVIDTELTVVCKKPDSNFKPRINKFWFDEVT